ncbi:hypothetical protein FMEXI_10128 [Fusarium mexicanum]|uniref:2EXR domain-containing protein n=1 Tax=Fusarium mexicanum TaxID=751941 RepID=A0A8H5MQM2_9HYPO|nr:hypothetical protein FMEXI_10128 [Fusarium mexicanum]
MATTFHQFPLLPRELRDEIWYFAIRSHHRGVQIFEIHKSPSYDDNGTQSTSLRDCLLKIYGRSLKSRPGLLPTSGEHIRPWYFGAPLGSKSCESLNVSPDKIVSTYMVDCGLWTACKESRRVIRKHFANPSNNPGGLAECGRVGYCSGSSPFYLSVWPGSDLFILQLDNFFDTNWSRIEAFAGTPESSPCPVESCREIGIEYDSDPEHGTVGIWRDVTFTVNFSFSLSPKQRLWLVDRNLKRKKGAASSHDSDTMQFYASGRKFVPVPLDKGEGNLTEWEYVRPVAGGNFRKSSIYYAWLANEVATNFRFPWPTILDHGHPSERRIGLLGWDDLEGS